MTRLIPLALAATLTLAACDAATPSGAADLTEAEVAETAAVVAEALADDTGGLMASARDLTAGVTADGRLTDGPRAVRFGTGDLPRPCRGGASVSYAEDTGTHVVSYRCGFENASITKGYTARLRYRFRDADGGFLARPWQDWGTVDSVAFSGSREGFVRRSRGDSLRSASEFEQTGSWTLSQLADDASPGRLAGTQTRSGHRTRRSDDGSGSRSFSVTLSSRKILIRESDDGLTHAVSGEVAYVATLEVVRGGEAKTRTVEGTVELDGNGRGLLRVLGLRNVYRVSLSSGDADLAG